MASGGGPKCHNCGKTHTENEVQCWYCEEDLDRVKNRRERPECFIATAVYGEHAWQTNLLRAYRDNSLQHSFVGRVFIDAYYFVSPLLANIIRKSRWLTIQSRKVLNVIVNYIQNKK